MKLLLRSWEGIETLNFRRITSRMVEAWLRNLNTNARPRIPTGTKTAARNSTGASITTLKCALDALRQVLDVCVESGHFHANPARNDTVADNARRMFKIVRRARV